MSQTFRILHIIVIGLLLSEGAYSQEEEKTDSLTTEQLFYNLDEVLVTGERPIAKMEQGSLVYDMPQLLKKLPADNAYDALTRIPGVTETNGQLQHAGRELTLVIDGKASSLSAEQVAERLRLMPADRVQKVDVMLSAPAYMHVSGQVINIVTKDNYGLKQLSGQLQGTGVFSKRSNGQATGSLLFSNNRFTLDAMYSFKGGTSYELEEYDAIHPLATGPVEYHESNDGFMRTIQHNYRLGLEYAFAKNHRTDLAYTGTWSSQRNHYISSGDAKFDLNSSNHNYLHNVDFGYFTPFGLKIGVSYTNYEMPENQNLEGEIAGERKDYLVESGQKIHKWDLTADQSHSFKTTWGVNYGAQMQITKHKSWQNTFLHSGEPVEGGTSSISYTERISSFYASLSNRWEKVSAEIGVQAENYNTPDWNKWHIYPNLNVTWKPNENHVLTFSLSSYAKYPSYWWMMNTVYHSSPYSESWGNPNLKPQNKYNITANWRLYRRFIINAIYYISDSWVIRMPYQPSDRMAVVMQYVNFNYRHNGGVGFTAQWNIGKWATGNATAAVIYLHDKCDNFHGMKVDRESVSGSFSATAAITPFPKQRLTLLLQHSSQLAIIQGVANIRPFFKFYATLRWTSQNDRFTVSLAANNFTNECYKLTDTWEGQNFTRHTYQEWRNFALSMVYKFGNKKEKKRKQVDTSRIGR